MIPSYHTHTNRPTWKPTTLALEMQLPPALQSLFFFPLAGAVMLEKYVKKA